MSQRWKHWERMGIFLRAQMFLVLPLALYTLPLEGPYVLVKIALLVPCVVLITLPAILFSTVGVDLYDFKEFGAVPIDAGGWVLIFLFWSLISLLWSLRPLRHAGLDTIDEPAESPR